jgi:alpha-L-fucosidase
LVDIDSKGAKLLMNIAPSPTGETQQRAYHILKEYADWMKINAEAIYGTRPLAPFKADNICMTQKEDGTVYYYYMAEKDETQLPAEIVIKVKKPAKNKKITLLGSNEELAWKSLGKNSFKIMIPEKLRENPPSKYVWVFKVF